MQAQQLARMASGITSLGTRMDALDVTVTQLDARVAALEVRVTALDVKVTQLDAKVTALDVKVTALDVKVTALDTKVTECEERLSRQMRVLHEDLIDRIKALAPDFGPIRREFTEADDTLRESLDRRLVPVEAFVRGRRRPRPS